MRLARHTCPVLLSCVRTFVIGLAIVGLLLPGGVLMTLCRCDGGSWKVLGSGHMPSCCPAAEQAAVGLSLSANEPPCGACHIIVVKTPEREAWGPVQPVPELPPLALCTPAPLAFAAIPTEREPLASSGHDLAPPGRSRSLPLRI